jgi:hypothetical protein
MQAKMSRSLFRITRRVVFGSLFASEFAGAPNNVSETTWPPTEELPVSRKVSRPAWDSLPLFQ